MLSLLMNLILIYDIAKFLSNSIYFILKYYHFYDSLYDSMILSYCSFDTNFSYFLTIKYSLNYDYPNYLNNPNLLIIHELQCFLSQYFRNYSNGFTLRMHLR